MGSTFRKVFSSASANVNNWLFVPITFGDGWTGTSVLGDQVAKFTLTNSANSGATMAVAIIDGGDYVSGEYANKGVVEYTEFTCSATARRTGYDNASGDYVMSVASAVTNLNKIDIMGTGPLKKADGTDIDNNSNRRILAVGFPSIVSGTLTLDVTVSRAI